MKQSLCNCSYLLWVFRPLCTQQTCVILTLEGHLLTKRIQLAPLSPGREENRRHANAALDMWAIKMEKESTPLWVWLSVALLVIGAVTYVTMVYLIEFIMTFF